MSNRTKIVVLYMKEVIYTVVFAVLAVVLIVLLFLMFRKNEEVSSSALYQPGVYTSSIQMNDAVLDVEVVVDEQRINAIAFRNLSDEVATMYPLMQPCLDVISQQVYDSQSLENIELSQEGEYTSEVLLKAVKNAVEKAKIREE
ncbi:MAG: hypothetical protein ACI4F1_07620 [Bariatricus sp.]